MNQIYSTDFLVPNSSFRLGMSSVLNIGGNFFQYNYSPTPDQADARALLSDWLMVGQDIATAMKQRDPQQSELPLGV